VDLRPALIRHANPLGAGLAKVTIPPDLQAGLTTLAYLEEVRDVGEPRLLPSGLLWTIPMTIAHADGTPEVPAVTKWEILVEPSYPIGAVSLYPARAGGLDQSFPHQMANDLQKGQSFRSGNVCLTHEGAALELLGGSQEPHTAYHRLHWHVERLSEWLHRARAGTLLSPDDYFEHPDPRASKALVLAYHERPYHLDFWRARSGQHGPVDAHGLRAKQMTLYPVRFQQGIDTIYTHPWGSQIQNSDIKIKGLWLMLPALPVLAPWGYPRTWGELRSAVQAQGVDLDQMLQHHAEDLRDDQPHFLLLGYPIPDLVGGPAVRVHWQGILLPRLTKTRTANGFRPSPEGRWRFDRQKVLADHQLLTIYESANHHPAELGSRGLRPTAQQGLRVVLIGAGALGAPLAEHLARTGIHAITVLDDDVIKHGNLVRHPATLAEVGHKKAEALANRLNLISPHISAVGHVAAFPAHDHQQALDDADVIVDTTGSDLVIRQLASCRFRRRPVIVSVSLGWRAKALYAYAEQTTRFNAPTFFEAVLPHIGLDRPEDHLQHTPREGIGCWHPVFPATYTDVQLMVSCAAAFLEEILAMDQPGGFRVYEQWHDHGQWAGVRRRV
jgi:ThiF family